MRNRIRSIAFILLLYALTLACPYTANGQSNASAFYQNSLSNAINTLSPEQRGLYNGAEYVPTTLTTGGHQFFLAERFLPGTVVYNGFLYSDVNLLYDINSDDVIVENENGVMLKAVKDNIDEFVIDNHLFRHLKDRASLPSGFYDILFEKNNLVLCARREKKLKLSNWRESVTYFLIDHDKYSIVTKKNIVKVLSDKEKEIRNFIGESKLNLRKNTENNLIAIVRYYSTLKN